MKRFCVALLVCVMTIVVVACGNGKEKELSILLGIDFGYIPKEVIEINEAFTKKTGVKVVVEYKNYHEMHPAITKNAASDAPAYDVFIADLVWTAEFATKGYCADLTETLANVTNDIPPAIIDAFVYHNKIWAMPIVINYQMFFYNEAHLKKAGFSGPPKTIEEMVTQMKKVKEMGIVEYPWMEAWPEKEAIVCEYVWLAAALGGRLFDDEGNPIFNEGAGLEALQFMKRMLDEELVNPLSLHAQKHPATEMFQRGESTFITTWAFFTRHILDKEESAVGKDVKVGLIPVFERALGKYENDTVTVSGFQGMAVAANSKKQDLAKAYIKHFTAKETLARYPKGTPVWTSLLNDEEMRKKDPALAYKAKQVAAAHHRPKVVEYTDISATIQKYLYKALKDEMEIQDALDKACEEIRAIQAK